MNIDIEFSIGADSEHSASPTSYTNITFAFEFHKDKIQQHIKQLRTNLGKYKVPTVVFEFPESAKDFDFPLLSQSAEKEDKYYQVLNNGKAYRCLVVNDEEYNVMKKKIEKAFGKLTQLDNNGFVSLDLKNLDSFYDQVKEKKAYPISLFCEQCRIKAKLDLDPQFFNVFEQLANKIAPKFANSPLMAALPLLGNINMQFEVDSLEDLEEQLKAQIFSFAKYVEPESKQEEEKVRKDMENKERVRLYINFDGLGYIWLELQVRMFALFRSLVSI